MRCGDAMEPDQRNKTFEPAFKWTHYVFGNNMIAGTLQTITLVVVASLAFGLVRSCWGT